MEYLDVLDSTGKPTGEKKLKTEIHRDGDWHKSVHVWIINSKGELLIQKRSLVKDSHPGMWDISSAGHISTGEDSATTATRETEEELGLELEAKDFEYLFSVTQEATQRGGYINREFNDVYLLKLYLNISKLKLQKEEVAEVKFIPYEKLEEIIGRGDKDFVPHPDEYKKLFENLHQRSL